MKKKEWVAMLLAGGQGSRLGALTRYIAKPAVVFGGKYRIIDFSLSNCVNSGIDTVGVLTQYKPMLLNSYIGTGMAWDLNEPDGGVHVLPPFVGEDGGRWYKGTANAIYQNLDFINRYAPEYVLVLSGDHIYQMDYTRMLAAHKKNGAEVSVSVMEVPPEEACRFGVVSVDPGGRIVSFAEKPAEPESNLVSMGIYIFNTRLLQNALVADEQDKTSDNDFGKNVIPRLLAQGRRMWAFPYRGYWRDVGTIESYYTANMELLSNGSLFDLEDSDIRIMTNSNIFPPHYIGPAAKVRGSIVCNGSTVLGETTGSILSTEVFVDEGAVVLDSILLPGARVERGAWVKKSIIGERSVVEAGCSLGVPRRLENSAQDSNIIVIAEQNIVPANSVIEEGRTVFYHLAV
ncbi:MAG: glucose-1-phosphate adenylyltransferase [Gracilibacteraceae bacterium]|jgi:glucose-1-phosphate adenylyltransferase|nr:glucose-1-phosphate adenylyltransferase [Gracilibacteraceae bacterium]